MSLDLVEADLFPERIIVFLVVSGIALNEGMKAGTGSDGSPKPQPQPSLRGS